MASNNQSISSSSSSSTSSSSFSSNKSFFMKKPLPQNDSFVASEIEELKNIDTVLHFNKSYLERVWVQTVGLTGFIDLICYYQKFKYDELRAIAEASKKPKGLLGRPLHYLKKLWSKKLPDIKIEQGWLESHCLFFSGIFCLCWFLEGIRRATKIESQRRKDIIISGKNHHCGIAFIDRPLVIPTLVFIFFTIILPQGWFQYHFMQNEDVPEEPLKITSSTFYSDLEQYAKSVLKMVTVRVMIFAFWNPFIFKKKVSQIVTLARSIKRMLPILKSCQIPVKKIIKVIKIKRQRLRKRQQKKVYQRLWKKLTPEERKVKAAIRIQSNFRKRDARKTVKIMMSIKETSQKKQKETAEWIQRKMRGRLQKTRNKLRVQKEELMHLQQDMNKNKNFDIRDEKRKLLLSTKLRQSTKSRKRIMALIRPNAKFIAEWHSFVCICIIIENIPRLLQVNISHFVSVPILNEFMAKYGTMILDSIYLFDTIVDFFTGRFDDNGVLVPETMFGRWFSFITKTQGNTISGSFVRSTLSFVISAGPFRTGRWIVTFIFPVINYLLRTLQWYWIDLVRNFNTKKF